MGSRSHALTLSEPHVFECDTNWLPYDSNRDTNCGNQQRKRISPANKIKKQKAKRLARRRNRK